MSPRFVLGRKNVPCVAEVVNRSLKADCTDFTDFNEHLCAILMMSFRSGNWNSNQKFQWELTVFHYLLTFSFTHMRMNF